MKIFAAINLCLVASVLMSQTAFASGKMANVVSCNPSVFGGELVIERMVYDNAGSHRFDGVTQLDGRNFFYLKHPLKEKLSEALVKGNVVKKEFRWTGMALLGYMEESEGSALPIESRSLTEVIPLVAKKHRSPGASMTMKIEGKTISCAFTSAENKYSEVSVSFNYSSPTEESKQYCRGRSYPKSYNIKWFTDKGQDAVKSESVLASCGFRGPSYDVSVARVSTTGQVEVDLSRTKILHQAGGDLLSRHFKNLLIKENEP